MNLEEAIKYAHQRMREIGKSPDQYHFEPVQIAPTEDEETEGKFSVNAYNEIYIIVNPENYFGVFLLADDSAYNSDAILDCGAPEFTGKLNFSRIDDLAGWSLTSGGGGKLGAAIKSGYMEFLRVVY